MKSYQKHNILVVGSSNTDMVRKRTISSSGGAVFRWNIFYESRGKEARIKRWPLPGWVDMFHLSVKLEVIYLDISLSNYLKKKE